MNRLSSPDSYSYPWYYGVIAFSGTLLFGVWGFMALFSGESHSLAIGIFFFLMMIPLFWLGLRTSTHFSVDVQGIHERRLFKGEVSLPWVNLTEMRCNALDGSLSLMDLTRDIIVRVDPLLQDFDTLVEAIRAARPDIWSALSKNRFYPNPLFIILAIAMGLLMIIPGLMALAASQILAGVLLTLLGVIILFLLIKSPKRIALKGPVLEIGYLFKHMEIRVEEIKEIKMKLTGGARGEKTVTILIVLKDGKKIELGGFSAGIPVVYNVLRTWIEKMSAP